MDMHENGAYHSERKALKQSNGLGDLDASGASHEELFEIERSVRNVQNCHDEEQLKLICVSLVRQNFHQSKLLSQAVGGSGN